MRALMTVDESNPRVIVDGLYFQLGTTGIARVWRNWLTAWGRMPIGASVVLLDRGGTAPVIPGISCRRLERYDYSATGAEALALEAICRQEGADLLVSTYYSTPTVTPTLMVVYDMIPETLPGFDLGRPMWTEKRHGILHASRFAAISRNTRADLLRHHPWINPEDVALVPMGVEPVFHPRARHEVEAFRREHGIEGDYILLVGKRALYKNESLVFSAVALLPPAVRPLILCAGGEPESTAASAQPGLATRLIDLSDDKLTIAYSGALALVYPSLYEGFGLPIVESMACGCPVICGDHSALPEATGGAALTISGQDPAAWAAALCAARSPSRRSEMIERGLRRVAGLDWDQSAEAFAALVREAKTAQRDSATRWAWHFFRQGQAARQ
jgi:glycosyltransferase involved in cell wall biosynthesis